MGLFDFLKKNKDNKREQNSDIKTVHDNLPEYFELPYFGKLNIKSLDNYYDKSTLINGNEISIDLNFNNVSSDKSKMEAINYVLGNIDKFDRQNKVYIDNDFNSEDGETVKPYLLHHLEELNEEVLATLFETKVEIINPEKELLNKLTLVRLGFYPDNDDYFTTFDYSIGQDITQYLVVITTDKDGQLNNITMES